MCASDVCAACASDVCACVRFRCVSVRALQMCVWKTSHTVLDCSPTIRSVLYAHLDPSGSPYIVVKMVPRMAAVLRAPENFGVFRMFYLFFVVLRVRCVSITVYDRDTLLNIGSSVAQRKPDFEFLNAGGLFTDTASEPFVWVAKSRRRRRR